MVSPLPLLTLTRKALLHYRGRCGL